MKKLLIVLSVLTCFSVAQAEGTAKKAGAKKVKKTVTTTTTTEEVDADGNPVTSEQTTEKPETTTEPREDNYSRAGNLPSRNEDWYTLWGLGFSKTKYKGDIGEEFEDFGDAGSRSTGIALDLLGFYWPLADHKTMLGVIINGTSDSAKLDGDTITVTTSLLGFSVHHFFGQNIGDGFFVRGDIGFSAASFKTESSSGFSWDKNSDNTSLAVLFGGGYAWPISQETRLLLGLYFRPLPNYKFKNDLGESGHLKGTTTSVIAGFLF